MNDKYLYRGYTIRSYDVYSSRVQIISDGEVLTTEVCGRDAERTIDEWQGAR